MKLATLTEKQYRKYLKDYKTTNYPTAPASANDYADWWIEAVKTTLQEIMEMGGTRDYHYKKHQKDGPLLVVEENGKLPERDQKRFAAFKGIGLEIGLVVVVECIEDGDGGIIIKVQVNEK